MVRRFQHAKSGEACEVELAGTQYTVRTGGQAWGQGTSESHDFDDEDEARAAAEAKIKEITKNGFIETTTGTGGWKQKKDGKDRALPPARGGTAPRAESKPARKGDGGVPNARKAAVEEDQDEEEEDDAPAPAKKGGGGKRMFEFSEGASNKFWEIWIDGNEVYTRYGRIGSNGQTTVKDQGSPAGAKKLYDKLVAEKTGKGYEEKL
jgi:predicted DNA-binding WGR domain protein